MMTRSSSLIISLSVLIMAILLVGLTSSVGFTSNPIINDGSAPYTDQSLVCSWNISGDTTAINVTWYNTSTLYSTIYDNTTLNTTSTISSSLTLKNQNWRCEVTLFNVTSNSSKSYNVTVQNSAPTTPILYDDGSNDMGTTADIVEDQTFTYDLNSSDIDNDALLYYLKVAGFCSVNDSVTGAVSCKATHSDIALANETEEVTKKNVTFWVDDNDPMFAKSASLTVTFNITPVNDVPTISIPTQSVNVTDTLNTTINASDEEDDYPLSVELINTSPSNEVNDSIALSIEGNRTLRIIYQSAPDYNDVGNHTVLLNLTDARNASSLITFSLEVLSTNRDPYFTAISPENHSSPINHTYVLFQGDNLTINLSANDPDTADRTEILAFSDNTSLFVTETISGTATNTTNATGRINYSALNRDVGNHSVEITVTDLNGGSNTTTLNFTILNVNDPPIIYNQSYNASNTAGNINITPLVAYLDAPFRYQINYSDPDLEIGMDILNWNWSGNVTEFNITSAGLINFTPSGAPRSRTINITVTDLNGSSDTRTVLLEIKNNTAPRFNATFPRLNCSEGVPCTLDLSSYATDDDPGDNVSTYANTFINNSLNSFSMNTTTGEINFTPIQSEIGNYTLNITITDTRGASASQLLNITVNNTPDSPVWDRYNFGTETIVETHEFFYQLIATDKDLFINNSGENLSFTTNISWITITYQYRTNDTVYAQLTFTPNSTQAGNYTAQLNVTDSENLTNSTNVSFTVYSKTNPPNITAIEPYGNDSANDSVVQSWLDVSGASTKVENITLEENTSNMLFAVNATDDDQPGPPYSWLTYSWYYDGVERRSGTGDSYKNDTLSFGFFSAGNHTVTAVVNDSRLESTNWTWNLEVQNVNRPPILENNLTDNISIDSTTTFTDYFLRTDAKNRFFDPDDDFDSSGIIDKNETQNLTYTATSCSVATITFVGNSLKVAPVSVGNCIVTFNATDVGGLSVQSNLVIINVTSVPEGSSTAVTSSSSGGGGGGSSSSSSSSIIPFEKDVQKPKPLNIISPRLVTIYKNKSITIPIQLRNNWTKPLKKILLSSTANTSNISMEFDTNYIDELPVNSTTKVMLTVQNYRLGENFEVNVHANVSDPVFDDTALILFNSIEQTQEGRDAEVKVTFAQDLLSQNDECKELSEFIIEAQKQIAKGKMKEASETLDSVINGCRYLISKTAVNNQKPGIVRTPFFNLSQSVLKFLSYLALGFFLIISLAVILYYHHTRDEYDF